MGWLLEHQDQVDLDVTITEEDETTDSDESKSFSQKNDKYPIKKDIFFQAYQTLLKTLMLLEHLKPKLLLDLHQNLS